MLNGQRKPIADRLREIESRVRELENQAKITALEKELNNWRRKATEKDDEILRLQELLKQATSRNKELEVQIRGTTKEHKTGMGKKENDLAELQKELEGYLDYLKEKNTRLRGNRNLR